MTSKDNYRVWQGWDRVGLGKDRGVGIKLQLWGKAGRKEHCRDEGLDAGVKHISDWVGQV